MRYILVFSVLLCLALGLHRADAQTAHNLPLQGGAPVLEEPFSATRTLDYEPAPGSADPKPCDTTLTGVPMEPRIGATLTGDLTVRPAKLG